MVTEGCILTYYTHGYIPALLTSMHTAVVRSTLVYYWAETINGLH